MILSVILIGVCSFAATLVTYILAAHLGVFAGQQRVMQKGAKLEALVRAQGAAVLNRRMETSLTKTFPQTLGVYEVMRPDGMPLYGSETRRLYDSAQSVARHLNIENVQPVRGLIGGTVTRLMPVLGANGTLVGAVYYAFSFHPFQGSAEFSRTPLVIGTLMTPFFFIGLFTYLFSRRLSRKVNRPVQTLMKAIQKIQARDLDFVVEEKSDNELGDLLYAFEKMRQDLKEALLRQWSLEEERRELLAAISHDVRTPLTMIRGHAELLGEMEGRSSTAARYAETILRNVDRVTHLMSDLHTVAELERGQFAIRPRLVALRELLGAKIEEYQTWAAAEAIRVDLSYADAQDDTDAVGGAELVMLDPDRFAQILDNLIANALRFTPRRGQISLSVEQREDGLSVRVQDSGRGFMAGDENKVFRKFYQSDPSRTEGEHHRGLGLYIVKTLVEACGGTIAARNAPTGGAIVELFLPVHILHNL
ncbi:hypothetical protein ATW55_02400 [Ferroacidibacillus organovorans]|uniref:histidine kinase n=2 Tax=Ferroacidibacillus organovorans TaxID=1765683 RepID=A0A101XR15_9BACL|nr:hypothetical protein ATW55_02400 [Ferroacidibacillus organovorans]